MNQLKAPYISIHTRLAHLKINSMNKKNFYLAAGILLSACVISCGSASRDKLIIGTWSPVGPDGKADPALKIRFLENKIGVAERQGHPPGADDSITYEIKNEGKLLVTTERSGKVEEVEIIELNEKSLVFYGEKMGDTMKLVRQ